MASANRFPSAWEVLGKCIPEDHCRQVGNQYYLDSILKPGDVFLDHGCGAGKLKSRLEATHPGVSYHGVDIASSPEVAQREEHLKDLSCFHETDGTTLPFPENSFDMVNSNNVFEHVRHPEAVIREIHRILKPGGGLVASFAYLYPFHSFSLFNFTPYGWFTLLTDNGFNVRELRPGIDGIASILRGYHGGGERFGKWFQASPFHGVIERQARKKGLTVKEINMRKVMNAGVLVSYATKE
ncbi:MAG: class I SAM-dependent methyltransferase [Pseudodesulfovibrio sp.]